MEVDDIRIIIVHKETIAIGKVTRYEVTPSTPTELLLIGIDKDINEELIQFVSKKMATERYNTSECKFDVILGNIHYGGCLVSKVIYNTESVVIKMSVDRYTDFTEISPSIIQLIRDKQINEIING